MNTNIDCIYHEIRSAQQFDGIVLGNSVLDRIHVCSRVDVQNLISRYGRLVHPNRRMEGSPLTIGIWRIESTGIDNSESSYSETR